MKLSIDISQITILSGRQRQTLEESGILELAESIFKNGLLHPPTIREKKNEDGTISFLLVAGERRLKALNTYATLHGGEYWHGQEKFVFPMIPVNNLGEVSELEAEELELAENVKRVDLTWQEKARATEKLFHLRQRQKGGEFKPAALAQEIHGRRDGGYTAAIVANLDLAKALRVNPEIAKATSQKDALKLLKKTETAEKFLTLSKQVGSSYDNSKHELFKGNCLDYMRDCPAGKFSVILTDPPYGMGAHRFSDAGGKMSGINHQYDDSYESWKKLMEEWCPLAYKVAAVQSHAYVFCDQANFAELSQMMTRAGWRVFRTMLIAHKVNSGRVPLPQHGPRRQYETFLYAIKGDKTVNCIKSDVLSHEGDINTTHGAQKPVSLFVDILSRSAKPGDFILDTFAGSGTIFAAARETQTYAVGCEMEEVYQGMCLARIKEVATADSEPHKNVVIPTINLENL